MLCSKFNPEPLSQTKVLILTPRLWLGSGGDPDRRFWGEYEEIIMKVKNLSKCMPECCASCDHLNSYGLGGVKCELENGPQWSREDLVDAHYRICDEYFREIDK